MKHIFEYLFSKKSDLDKIKTGYNSYYILWPGEIDGIASKFPLDIYGKRIGACTFFFVPAAETNTKLLQSYHFKDTDIWLAEEDMDHIMEFMISSKTINVRKLDSRYIRIQ